MAKTKQHDDIHPRKLEILNAAITCFINQGYHQTGTRDIARTAGTSLGNLYNHFSGKEALLAFIAEMEEEEIAEFVAMLNTDASPPGDRLCHFIKAYSDYAAKPENALLGIELLAQSLRNETIADIFAENRNRLIGALTECLNDACEGTFSAALPAHESACMILDLIEGWGVRTLLEPEKATDTAKTLPVFILTALNLQGDLS